MPKTHAPEIATENWYQKLVPVFWYQFFVLDETGSKIYGLIFLLIIIIILIIIILIRMTIFMVLSS